MDDRRKHQHAASILQALGRAGAKVLFEHLAGQLPAGPRDVLDAVQPAEVNDNGIDAGGFSVPREIDGQAPCRYADTQEGPRGRRVSNDDLARLFELYDAHFFGDRLRRLVDQEANGRLSLRFSGRMRMAGALRLPS